MNVQKLTQKSIEAIQEAQKLASNYHNPQVEQEHLFLTLVEQEGGLISSLLQKMGVDIQSIGQALEANIRRMPQITGSQPQGQIYISGELDATLNEAERQAAKMKDEFTSVEHLMLGILKKPSGAVRDILSAYHVEEKLFREVLKQTRGNARVTSDNPESTYDVLSKYGQDLVELARQQKLDPVIGRDSEIRSVIRILSRKTKNNPCLIGEPGVGKRPSPKG